MDSSYEITKFLFQRSLGFIYFIGFLIIVNQYIPLVGKHGLLPIRQYKRFVSFKHSPSLFWWNDSDPFIQAMGWLGLVLSFFVMTGMSDFFGIVGSVAIWACLWVLYLSFVNLGQTWYSFGWESMLLEVGFLAIFLGPIQLEASPIPMWLILWVSFRNMFGAGLIKLRGDPCWRNLTCLHYHYRTQPMPNPLSWYFDKFPGWFHKVCVGFNHFVELIVPFGLFAPAPFFNLKS